MRMQKRQFRIGELAKHLNVKKFVIRFWEKEFELYSLRSHGGQRFYDEKDIHHFSTIKKLLYEEGFTIAGARKYLQDTAQNQKQEDEKPLYKTMDSSTLNKELLYVKERLLFLKELL
jgi:DNA-binding transcriptional MerR regulator